MAKAKKKAPLLVYRPEQWRDANLYPGPDASVDRWATEFLMRNPSFRAAIRGISKLPGPKKDPASPFRRRWSAIAKEFGIAHPLLRRWGFDSAVRFSRTPYSLRTVSLTGVEGDWFLGEDYGWGAALVFDLRIPIAPQLRSAERILKGTTRRGVTPLTGAQRSRHADYRVMLQILDARSVKASWREIGEEVFPKKTAENATDHVKKLYRRAVQIRDGGYRRLPAAGTLSTTR
jgi:hypothetical protein